MHNDTSTHESANGQHQAASSHDGAKDATLSPYEAMMHERLAASRAALDQAAADERNARATIERKDAERKAVCDNERAEHERHKEAIDGYRIEKAKIDTALLKAKTKRDEASALVSRHGAIVRNTLAQLEIEEGDRIVRSRNGGAK